MREQVYPTPCPSSFELVKLDGDDFVRLPNANVAVGEGVVFIYTTMTGETRHVLEGCVVEVDADEVA